MRPANEIDFWRGLALVSIFINHIPGFAFERFTHRNFGLSDSAELFVFLAGWSLRRIASDAAPMSLPRLVLRLGARGVTLYAAQILITSLALGLTAATAIWLDNPLLLEWNNAAAAFQNPVPAHLGLVLLTYQLGFFDILPLYVVLMLGAPLLAVVDRLTPRLVVPISLVLYALALAFAVNIPTWPVEGVWYFNPFAWQLIFVLGFVLGGDETGLGAWARRHASLMRPIGCALLILGAWVVLHDYSPDPMGVPRPRLFFVFDKTFLSPARLVHFLALAVVFAGTFKYVLRWMPAPARFLAMLGRNSLNVFCVGSLVSLAGQMARFAFGGNVSVDCCVLVAGITTLGFTAWLSELRERLKRPAGPAPLSHSRA